MYNRKKTTLHCSDSLLHKNPNERPCRKLDSHREQIRATEAAEVEPGHSVFINRCFYKVNCIREVAV